MDFTNVLLGLSLISNNLFLNQADPEFEALQIIGGDVAEPDQFKYVVGINCGIKGCACSGSIIDEQFVITAAHCFFEDDGAYFGSESIPASIVAGTNDVGNYQDPRRVEVDVQKIYAPSSYGTPDSYLGDIAVLKLKNSLQLEANQLEKLRLPVKTKSRFAGKRAVVAGFGTAKVTFSVKRNRSVEAILHQNYKLHAANVSIVANDKCNDPLISDNDLCGQIINKKGAKHYGACDGDSGGPLVYKSKVLIGVFTNGLAECNERSDYGVYQRIKSYLDFIHKAINDDTSDMLVKSWD